MLQDSATTSHWFLISFQNTLASSLLQTRLRRRIYWSSLLAAKSFAKLGTMDSLKRKVMPRRFSMKDGSSKFCLLICIARAPGIIFTASWNLVISIALRFLHSSSLLNLYVPLLAVVVPFHYRHTVSAARSVPNWTWLTLLSRLSYIRRSWRRNQKASRERIRRSWEARMGTRQAR